MRNRRSQSDSSEFRTGSRPRLWLLAACIALFTARPLVAGDGAASEGDGALVVMLWLLMLLVWMVVALRQRRFTVRIGWLDGAVLVFFALVILSGLVAVGHGSPRPAINLAWEWAALAVGYFLLRQCLATAAEARAALVAMIAVAAGAAMLGIHQFFVQFPQDRAMFDRHKDDPAWVHQHTGMSLPPHSPERRRYEDRLKSNEPFARFALSNSLAGLLAPWLIVAVGVGVSSWREEKGSFNGKPEASADSPKRRRLRLAVKRVRRGLPYKGRDWLLMPLVAALIAGCLLLTNSRSGVLAAVLGAVALGFCLRRRVALSWRMKSIGLAICAVLLAGAWLAGGVNRLTLSEAGKSLGYRGQYWRSTVRLVADHPLGVGLGQFPFHYPQYKLPQASEEIKDPHNFLLEAAAAGGLLALLAMLFLLAAYARRCWQTAPDASAADEADIDAGDIAFRFVAGGALAGVLLAFVAGIVIHLPIFPLQLVLLVGGFLLTLVAFAPWIRAGALSPRLPLVGAGVLLVHLLAAGSLSYPGVAGSLWLLIAVGLSAAESPSVERRFSARAAWAAVAGAALLLIVAWLTYYRPVLESKSLTEAARAEQVRGNPAGAARYLEEASRADPYSSEAASLLAQLHFAQWKESASSEHFAAWQEAGERMLALAPRSYSLWLRWGEMQLEAFRKSGQAAQANAAAAAHRRAVELYPNSAQAHARLAETLDAAAESAAAQGHARRALQLNEITRRAGHEDRLLTAEVAVQMQRIAGSSR